jgi:hypothetical protein
LEKQAFAYSREKMLKCFFALQKLGNELFWFVYDYERDIEREREKERKEGEKECVRGKA